MDHFFTHPQFLFKSKINVQRRHERMKKKQGKPLKGEENDESKRGAEQK